MVAITLIVSALLVVSLIVVREARQRHIGIWLGAYLEQRWRRVRAFDQSTQEGPTHILFCMVDHFEPISAGSTHEQQRGRMRQWLERYPNLARKHLDSDRRPVQHTWFYPGEDYDPEYLDDLAQLCRHGIGEIELHLHHGHDTAESLRAKFLKAIAQFEKHGALVTQESPPRYTYGFIHGNMALDNSRNDPSVCGVDEEITILKDTGCYADFSMPTAPCVSQTKTINAIYYASDDPTRPKSHDTGVDVEVGRLQVGDLMIIQGPLAFDWHNRKWKIMSRIENAEIQDTNPPTPHRISNWVRQHIHVKGRPEWVIVKVSCNGAEDRNREDLLGDMADRMYSFLESEYRDRSGYRLHYVTARELYNIVKAAEAGMTGDPGVYRDYVIPPYRTHSAWGPNP